MRELIFRNLTTMATKKRDVSIEEIVKRDRRISSTKKRSIYFVRGVQRIKSKKELQEWINNRKNDPDANKKFFHILRRCSTQNGQDKLICKMRGSFYIISGDLVYNIVFIHVIKIKFLALVGEV